MAYKTRFIPQNPAKYVGDSTNIVCRSLWERSFAKYCDENSGVLKWGSEEVIVPYLSPVDGRMHRYFTDFWIEVNSTGGIKRFLIEIKPASQTMPPKQPKRQTKRFIKEAQTFAINKAKWTAADIYARERGWTFLVLTERHLYGKK